jgi:DGQHR domain-containing protein
MITTSFPLTFLARQVRLDSAVKGGNPRMNTNRPLMHDHVRSIREYLIKNRNGYILPPVTLNARQMPQVHVQRTNAPVRLGFLVVGDGTMFDVTDGQHRIAAIAGTAMSKTPMPPIMSEAPELENDGMAVLIVVEDEMARIHQDFADAAQTKQIPASLLAAYNTREPVNRVLTRIVDQSEFLKGRVDETSKTLAKLSQSVFLLNQVRGLVKELLIGDYAVAEDTLSRYASQQLGTAEKQDAFVARAKQLLEVLTEHMQPWRTIVRIPPGDTMSSQIPDLRKEFLNLTATGLVIIGRVAFFINKHFPEDQRATKYIELATGVDWKRGAEIWQGTVMLEGERLVSSREPVRLAAERVQAQLGLSESANTNVA